MRIAVIGAGALGSLVGGCLARGGQSVTLFNPSNREHIYAIQRHGLMVETPQGHDRVTVQATTSAEDLYGFDLVILLVKAYATAAALRSIPSCLGRSRWVLSLQNGTGMEEEILKIVPVEKFLRGATSQGATLVAPGHVRWAGQGTTYIGCWQNGSSTEAESVINLFNQAGLETRWATHIQELVWSKLIINSAVNPLAALFDVPNGELLTDSHLREVLHGVTRESVAVARALNYAFSDPEMIAKVDEVCRRTAENISSMLQDVRQGKTTEIEFINGAIVHAAQQSRIPAPLNRLLLKLIRRISA